MGKYHKLQLQRSVQTPIDFRRTGPAVGSGPVVPERITSSRSSERRNFWGLRNRGHDMGPHLFLAGGVNSVETYDRQNGNHPPGLG